MSLSLRPYQSTAVDAAIGHLSAGKSTLLVAPTGSGKTVMAAAIAERFGKVLVIAHRRELLDQARQTFGADVRACSVQSFLQRASHFPKWADLLVIDEAHRAAAEVYRRIIERYAKAARLGLTATPLRTDGRGLCDAFDEMLVCSGMPELIASGDLVPYRALEAPDEALKQLAWMKRSGGDYATKDLGELMNTPRLVGDVVREYLKHGNGRRAVCFAVNVEHSRALAEAFRAAGVNAAHVDGTYSGRTRKAALDNLSSGDLRVLCNVNLFTEGWDCPPVSCVIMARPTASLTLYLQCVGRGMRPFEGKADLKILDHAGNMQRHGYPDVEREWSLESERDKANRLASERERERLAALGFDSIEAELEEKERASQVWLKETYSLTECAELLGGIKRFNASQLMRRSKITRSKSPTRQSSTFRFDKSGVDALAKNLAVGENTYSSEEVRTLLGYTGRSSVLPFLKSRGVVPVRRFGCDKEAAHRLHFSKSEIDALAPDLSGTVQAKEACLLLGISIDWLYRISRELHINPIKFYRKSHYTQNDLSLIKASLRQPPNG